VLPLFGTRLPKKQSTGSNPYTKALKKPLDFKLLNSAFHFFWQALFHFILPEGPCGRQGVLREDSQVITWQVIIYPVICLNTHKTAHLWVGNRSVRLMKPWLSNIK
jgi:hypothetical protein